MATKASKKTARTSTRKSQKNPSHQDSHIAAAPATISNPGIFRTDDRQKLRGQVEIEQNRLERFPNRTLVRRYHVEFTTPEFTCLCPKTGFPDFATLHITYVPDKWCVELKSLKLYINAYRDKHVFHEDVVNVILDELIQLLDPHEIQVVGDFNVRGNIKTVIRASHAK